MVFKNLGFKNRLASSASHIRMIGDAIIIRHILFSLPFGVLALLLESGGHPPAKKVVLILLAAASARNAANALNRVVDAEIDARNHRTAGRHIPAGLLSKKSLLLFSALMLGVLVVSAALLNPLCVMLLPLAIILVIGYSYTKRFTWLCHYWLGLACAAAPMGAFVALSGTFKLSYFFLAGAHALWVAGFDIIYAGQDLDFDRQEKLHSVPARFGLKKARLFALISHVGTVILFLCLPLFWKLGWLYFTGIGISAILLACEHIIALGGSEKHIKIASYSINEVIPLFILAFSVMDIYFGSL